MKNEHRCLGAFCGGVRQQQAMGSAQRDPRNGVPTAARNSIIGASLGVLADCVLRDFGPPGPPPRKHRDDLTLFPKSRVREHTGIERKKDKGLVV